MAFIDAHAKELGIEPICRELRVAPSSYHTHAARLADPDKRSARARRDDEIREQIKRVHDASFGLYGTRKVWYQLHRDGIDVAKCTVERLMRAMGLAGIRRGKTCVTTVSNPKAPCPLDRVNRAFKVERPNALWVVDFTYGASRDVLFQIELRECMRLGGKRASQTTRLNNGHPFAHAHSGRVRKASQHRGEFQRGEKGDRQGEVI
jgi:hypothetical protein